MTGGALPKFAIYSACTQLTHLPVCCLPPLMRLLCGSSRVCAPGFSSVRQTGAREGWAIACVEVSDRRSPAKFSMCTQLTHLPVCFPLPCCCCFAAALSNGARAQLLCVLALLRRARALPQHGELADPLLVCLTSLFLLFELFMCVCMYACLY